MLLFVYTTTRGYFKLSWNTTVLSQSNCRNFSCNCHAKEAKNLQNTPVNPTSYIGYRLNNWLLCVVFLRSKERATSSLLAEPGYSLDTVCFLVGGRISGAESAKPKFSFKSCRCFFKILVLVFWTIMFRDEMFLHAVNCCLWELYKWEQQI